MARVLFLYSSFYGQARKVCERLQSRLVERGHAADVVSIAEPGPDPAGYAMVRRALDVGGRLTCASDLYLPASRFGKILRMAEKRLTDVNVKALLESEFSAPTLQSEGVARVVALSAADCRVMGVAKGAWGLEIHIVSRSFGRVPITWQRMVVPPTPQGLKLDFHPPGSAGDASP